MSQETDVSHADIYHKLGTLEGKMDALIAKTSEYKSDLDLAFSRIRSIEERQSWVMGAAVVVSAIIPVMVHIIGSNFHVRFTPEQKTTDSGIVRNI